MVEGLNGAPEESMVVDRPSMQAAGVTFHQQDPYILKVKKVDFMAFIAMVLMALPRWREGPGR
jgi:hypothetical protein